MKFVVKNKVLLLVTLVVVSACSSIDCPMNSQVRATYGFVKADGTSTKIADTITVTALRGKGDTLLLNRSTDIHSFSIPVSYAQDEDVLCFRIADTLGTVTTDTVRIRKISHPHLEAVDCAPKYFYTVTDVQSTTYGINNIVINDKEVNYDISEENFHIYLNARR